MAIEPYWERIISGVDETLLLMSFLYNMSLDFGGGEPVHFAIAGKCNSFRRTNLDSNKLKKRN